MDKQIRLGALFLFICLSAIQAQEDQQQYFVLLNGIVMDAATQAPLVNVHFFLNGSSAGASDSKGRFALYINEADTIVFTHLGYSNLSFTISDTLSGNRFIAGIFMKTDTLSVGEVIVIPHLGDLKAEILMGNNQPSKDQVNAQNNINISTYQGVNSQATLGDPQTNYQLLKQRQVINAYEKGGIPSDKMIGLNVVTMIPAAIYLLANGFPQRPEPPRPQLSQSEMDRVREIYRATLQKRKEK